MAENFAGKIESIKIDRFPHPEPYIGRYSPNNEYYQIRATINVRLDDGTMAYVAAPAVTMSVCNSPVCAVVIYDLHGESERWYKETGTNRVATAGQSNDNSLTLAFNVGDTIRFRGTVKQDRVSRIGNRYRIVNRAKLIA